MKRMAIAAATLLTLAGLAASGARAEICIDFTEFIDGLEITIEGDVITGWWRNFDGEGNDIPIWGIIRDGLPLPCKPGLSIERNYGQNPAKAGIACIWDWGCENSDSFEGADWYFLFDDLDGTFDFGVDDLELGPPGRCSIDEVPYEILLGPCPFGPDGKGSAPGITLQQAVQRRLEEQ